MVLAVPTPAQPSVAFNVRSALDDMAALANAASEIVRGQLGIGGLIPISTEAGQLLFSAGVVASVDDGVVLFHERIGRDKPGLRRFLRIADIQAGRIKKTRRTAGQRAMDLALKAGEVRRVKGKIKGLTAKGKRAVNAAKRKETLRKQAILKKRQLTARAKLAGLGKR